MPQFETEHKGSTIKITSTIVDSGMYRWAVSVDGVLQQALEIAPSATWDDAREQGLMFAKSLIDAGK